MNPFGDTATRGIKRLAFLAMLVLVLRCVAVEWHQAVAHHPSDASCEFCLVVERGGTGAPPAVLPSPGFVPLAAPPGPGVCPVVARRAPAPLPRGPPSSCS